jgi:hypothetical protein
MMNYSGICSLPHMSDNKHWLVIVTFIWQKLSNVEHKLMLLVKNYWQLFSHIIGETLLIVRNYWRNPISYSYVHTNRKRLQRSSARGMVALLPEIRENEPSMYDNKQTPCKFPQISGINSSINELNTCPYSECIWLFIPHIFGLLELITINIRATALPSIL